MMDAYYEKHTIGSSVVQSDQAEICSYLISMWNKEAATSLKAVQAGEP